MSYLTNASRSRIQTRGLGAFSSALVIFWIAPAFAGIRAPKQISQVSAHLEVVRWTINQSAEANGSAAQHSQPHLAEWLQLHSNMTLQQQEKALRDEPGFARLPVSRQQRLMERLRQLNSMPPQQRERVLDRMEALERLSPEQRQQLRAAMQQASQLPEKQRQAIREALHNLRQLPQDQQEATINSVQFKKEFSDGERHILETLIQIQTNRQSQAAVPSSGK